MRLQKNFAEKLIDFLSKDYNSGYFRKAEDYVNYMENILDRGFSVNWNMGGTYGNCWGDKGTVSAEPEPEMTVLDDFLMENYPSTSFMQYKKISRSIQTDTYNDHDYYGGSTTHGKKSLSFADLQEALLEIKLEEQDEVIDTRDLLQERASLIFPSKKQVDTSIPEAKKNKKYKK